MTAGIGFASQSNNALTAGESHFRRAQTFEAYTADIAWL
jgi:hypothetical protein